MVGGGAVDTVSLSGAADDLVLRTFNSAYAFSGSGNDTIRFGGACSLAHAGCMDSSHGNAIATPELCKKVRRFSFICSKIIGFALRHEATPVQGSHPF